MKLSTSSKVLAPWSTQLWTFLAAVSQALGILQSEGRYSQTSKAVTAVQHVFRVLQMCFEHASSHMCPYSS